MSQYVEVGALPFKSQVSSLQAKITSLNPPTVALQPTAEPSFFSKYGLYLLGAVAVGGLIWWRRRKSGGK